MKRFTTSMFAALALAMPLAAQQQTAATAPAAPAAAPGSKPVATVNGQVITQETLDALYDRLGTKLRDQYERNGGKAAYLDNYLRKRLLVQEAIKKGFDKQRNVQLEMEAAKEAALFDLYVRDVVANEIVTDESIKQYYTSHPDEFQIPEQVKIRHIVVVPNGAGPRPKSKEQALEVIKQVAMELNLATVHAPHGELGARQRQAAFEEAAKKYSEDGAAPQGGDLGWVNRGLLDPDFEKVAWELQPGTMSGIVETKFGYHLIYVEGRRPQHMEPFEIARPRVREFLMTQHGAEVVEAVARETAQLLAQSKVAVYPENIK